MVIDGEAVVYGDTGRPDFQALRRELGGHKSSRVRYHAFDLLYLDGYDLRDVGYVERKRLLEEVLKRAPHTFVYVEYLKADGARVFEEACKLGLEGVVAKRGDAPYRSGRQESWIKLKCSKSETFPIVAFVEKLGGLTRAKSPPSMSAGMKTPSCSTRAKSGPATPKRQRAKSASGSTRSFRSNRLCRWR